MSEEHKQATSPEELTKLFTELANAKDAKGLADLSSRTLCSPTHRAK